MNVVAIHQPNFLPWFGYFNKIKSCTDFVFLDDVRFTRNAMINRVKIKSRDGDKIFITVPVSHCNFERIDDVKIVCSKDDINKVLNVIEYNYREMDYFKDIYPWISEMILNDWEYLSDMNIHIIKNICKSLRIDTNFWISSCLGYDENLRRTDRLVEIVKRVGGDTYLSGNGSDGYLEKEKFGENGIGLKFQNLIYPKYPQKYGEFSSGLSILDMLMNLGIEGTRKYL